MQRLDAVNDRDRRSKRFKLLQNQVEIRLGQQLQIGGLPRQSLPSQFHLLRRFLCTHVKNRAVGRHGRSALQKKGAFANTRITPH